MLSGRQLSVPPAAPAVRIPTLDTRSPHTVGGVHTWKEAGAPRHAVRGPKRSPGPPTELHVVEYDAQGHPNESGRSLVDYYYAPSPLSIRNATEPFVKHDVQEVSHDTSVHPTFDYPATFTETQGGGVQRLSDESFVDQLVKEVRMSCRGPDAAGIHFDESESVVDAHRAEGVSTGSPDPRQPLGSPRGWEVRGQRSATRSPREASRSPRVEAVLLDQPETSPREAGRSSPEPRAPLMSPYAPGSALGNSLRRGRSSGVARHRSTSRHSAEDAAVPTTPRAHPTWQAKPITGPHPAWNQNKPTPKARPVVSAPGSALLSRTGARAQSSERRDRPWRASQPRTRSHSQPLSRPPSAEQPESRSKTTSKSPRLPATTISITSPNTRESQPQEVTRRSTTKPLGDATPFPSGEDAVPHTPSPAAQARPVDSPPSARALFTGTSSHTRSDCSPGSKQTPSTQPRTPSGEGGAKLDDTAALLDYVRKLEATTHDALERAAKAEARCERLEAALRSFAAEQEKARDELRTRYAQLSGQVQFAVQWIHGFDASTPQHPSEAPASTSPSTNGRPAATAKAGGAVYPFVDVDDALQLTPGLQGATPTPTHNGRLSSGSVPAPPSPPLVLQLHSAQKP